MKMLWCWRCREKVPMLDEDEYRQVDAEYERCFRRGAADSSGEPSSGINEYFRPVRELYERLTGWEDMHHNAIMHHRLKLYGPICPTCGKPLRTPRASFCAACGTRSLYPREE